MGIWNFKKEEKVKSYWLDEATINEFLSTDCNLSKDSEKSYMKNITIFGGWLESKNIVTVTEPDILTYMKNEIRRRGVGGAYAHNAILKKYAKWLYVKHMIPSNPFDTADYASIGLTYKDAVRSRKTKQASADSPLYSLEEIAELLLVLSDHPKEDVLAVVQGGRHETEIQN